MRQVADILRSALGSGASKVPTRSLPSLVVRAAARLRPEFASIVPDLGYRKQLTNEKARAVLGWEPRNPQLAIVAAGRSMVERGLAGPSASS